MMISSQVSVTVVASRAAQQQQKAARAAAVPTPRAPAERARVFGAGMLAGALILTRTPLQLRLRARLLASLLVNRNITIQDKTPVERLGLAAVPKKASPRRLPPAEQPQLAGCCAPPP